jgi:hypothetical protein
MLVSRLPRLMRKIKALEHIKQSREGDLILFDRNYPSYIFLAEIFQTWATFYGSLFKKVI